MAALFDVFLVTPEREVWSGRATILIARGTEGEIGIQAGHIPTLIQLSIGPLFIQTPDERVAAAVDGGFLHVTSTGMDTRVDILAEHAELRDEIDLDRARAQKDEAARRIAAQDNGRAGAELAKALTRLNLHGQS